jgi:hypothetical protein
MLQSWSFSAALQGVDLANKSQTILIQGVLALA